jgi:hypothetical protein
MTPETSPGDMFVIQVNLGRAPELSTEVRIIMRNAAIISFPTLILERKNAFLGCVACHFDDLAIIIWLTRTSLKKIKIEIIILSPSLPLPLSPSPSLPLSLFPSLNGP